MNKVIESMLGKSIEQSFEEIQVEEVRAKRQAEIDAQLRDKGKNAEVIFEEDVSLEDIAGDDDEEDDEEVNDEEDDIEEGDDEEDDDEEKVFSASSHSSDDDNDDDDNQGDTGVTVTEASGEQNVDDLMNDDANEVSEGADGEGEHVDDQNVDQAEKLILRIEPDVEEGEIRHTYTLDEVLKIFNVNEDEFKFAFEEELNAFDINHQPEYEYKYVEDADVYDRVDVEDCTDEDILNEDTSEFPTLMEFFSEENREDLRRKVAEILKDKNFDGTTKDPLKEERKKWFKESNERKFKRPLKYYQRDRSISLGDIISWGFLPQVNAYAIRRECGVQYFERLHDVMSLPWWDVDELSKVRKLGYPVRKNDIAIWGLIKFEALKNFKHWKPHYPKRVRRVNPETGNEEIILNVKNSKAMKNIPVPKMEQEFYKGFMGWVYSCISTEAKGINSESKWNSKWWSLEEKEKLKAERERKKLEENRGKWMKLQTEEAKKAKKENERLRNLLRKKPKQREESFKLM
ncbi:MATH and LRR domain-containing protein PFE0570w-like [Helianthus annuus]|uniref:MATH and LRR domain-containing protein PFE0570w-like n=1 Tax=Helianthus annuus TaxID=4232 RepID=UPI000B900B72|nr:MATH and LRR domain-containing protein PFE0570w-like [Helianthus annuus]